MASSATFDRAEAEASSDGEELVHAFRVGSLRCIALSDGFIAVPAMLLAAEVSPEEIKAFLNANGQDPEMLRNPISCLLVTLADGRTVVVDAGCGNVPGSEGATIPTAGRFAEAVDHAGIDRAGIDLVLVSHIHPYHGGGLFDADGHPFFPNADYLVSRQEVEFWRSPATDLGGTLMPPPRRGQVIALAHRFLEQAGDRLKLFEAGEPAIDGVETLPLPGHTAGQVGFLFDGGDATLPVTRSFPSSDRSGGSPSTRTLRSR